MSKNNKERAEEIAAIIQSGIKLTCPWCDSENIEHVGTEYNGTAIMHCKDCAHEFYSRMIDLDKKKEWKKTANKIISEIFEGLQDALEYEEGNKEDPDEKR